MPGEGRSADPDRGISVLASLSQSLALCPGQQGFGPCDRIYPLIACPGSILQVAALHLRRKGVISGYAPGCFLLAFLLHFGHTHLVIIALRLLSPCGVTRAPDNQVLSGSALLCFGRITRENRGASVIKTVIYACVSRSSSIALR